MADDERVLLFLERIEEAAMAAAYNKSESMDASSKRASETAVDEEVNLVELEIPKRFSTKTSMCCRLNSYICSRHRSTQHRMVGVSSFPRRLPRRRLTNNLQRAPRGCSGSAVVVHLFPGRASQNYLFHFSRSSQT